MSEEMLTLRISRETYNNLVQDLVVAMNTTMAFVNRESDPKTKVALEAEALETEELLADLAQQVSTQE